MNLVVSDTSPLRALANLKRLDLLSSLFATVYVPPAVLAELGDPKTGHMVVDEKLAPFLVVRSPSNPLAVAVLRHDLDEGEAQAIVLALEMNAGLLIDERLGRLAAGARGLSITGTLGILIEARKRGLIEQIAPLLMELKLRHRFFLSDAAINIACENAGETPPGA